MQKEPQMASLLQFSRRFFASALKSKAAAAGSKNVKPGKQKLMKKQKMAAAREASASKRGNQADRATPFIQALFNVSNESAAAAAGTVGELEWEELQRRTVIAKSWSKWKMLQLHSESLWEKRFLQSKLAAMQALTELSPQLAECASAISYEPAPASIKPPAETPPSELPFSSV